MTKCFFPSTNYIEEIKDSIYADDNMCFLFYNNHGWILVWVIWPITFH